ncbi:MAG: hypothetical protein R3336_02960 [Phycisphaeraceae bacterium]|nr:hypothetical protein [Phycisphaeraceae bacterium]
MKIQVSCPSCEKQLMVPAEAIGHQARCPGCEDTFEVVDPSEESVFDEAIPSETVSHWLNEEMEAVAEEQEEKFQELTEKNRKVDEGKESLKEVENQNKQTLKEKLAGGKKKNEPAGESLEETEAQKKEQKERNKEQLAAAISGEKTADEGEKASAGVEEPQTATAVSFEKPRTGSVAEAYRNATVETEGDYPDNLHVVNPIPRLVVRRVKRDGVLLAFDSIWLEHTGFRLSLPFRCVYTGSTERTDLYIRSLAFIDRSQGSVRSPSELFQGHGQSMLETLTRHEVLEALGRFDQLPKPFNFTVPYFVCSDKARSFLECTTNKREDGGITCNVLIPDPTYALAWLSRVNGTVGEDYEMLRDDVRQLSTDAWTSLPIRCQELLESWIEFEPGERFLLYLNDQDFLVKDAGLAGLVITDHRLIYRKYKRKGDISLQDEATLLLKAEEDYVAVSLKTESGTMKICKLRIDDVPRLADQMRDLPMCNIALQHVD